MNYFITSNSLSLGHGDSPLEGKNCNTKEISRGFVIYITGPKICNGYDAAVNCRIHYCDYKNNTYNIKDIIDLEKAVIEYNRINTNDTPKKPPQPFPHLLSNNLSDINFGWDPCDISYVLDYPYWQFQPINYEECRSPQDSIPLNQPVVFRKDKIIYDTVQKNYEIKSYIRNKSFYNLNIFNDDDVSIIRLQNFMLDENGNDIIYNNKEEWHYCMDMHVRLTQGARKLLDYFEPDIANLIKSYVSEKVGRSMESIYIPPELPNFLTIVFDPPQCNGGGSGPPKL